jgi:hypothetical protein
MPSREDDRDQSDGEKGKQATAGRRLHVANFDNIGGRPDASNVSDE